jgi:hypothetical protein
MSLWGAFYGFSGFSGKDAKVPGPIACSRGHAAKRRHFLKNHPVERGQFSSTGAGTLATVGLRIEAHTLSGPGVATRESVATLQRTRSPNYFGNFSYDKKQRWPNAKKVATWREQGGHFFDRETGLVTVFAWQPHTNSVMPVARGMLPNT